MKLWAHRWTALSVLVLVCLGCADEAVTTVEREVAPTPRKMVVWLDETGLEAETADRLAAVGVDQLVVRRGLIRISGAAPVVQLLSMPAVAGTIPLAAALEVRGLASTTDERVVDAVWAALEADFGDSLPSELILDLPELGESAEGFVARLANQSGLAVVPILTVSQLGTEAGRAVASAAHSCIVPVFGSQSNDLRGLNDKATQPLVDQLSAVADLGVRVRVAVALRARTEPAVAPWAEDIDILTDISVAEIKRASILDRTFAVGKPVTWGGRDFNPGDEIAVAWMDTARLDSFLAESHRTILPEIGGWDLVTLPPVGPNLGLDRDELIRYLAGEGPQPVIDVRVNRSGRTMSVEIVNTSVFRSAITAFGNYIQIELASGALVASSRGEFDRVILGSVAGGEWRPNPEGGPDAVRFVETYLAPGETVKTGSIRLPSSRSRVVVRWQVQISDGSSVTGVVD
jgi:hypothetical protein